MRHTCDSNSIYANTCLFQFTLISTYDGEFAIFMYSTNPFFPTCKNLTILVNFVSIVPQEPLMT